MDPPAIPAAPLAGVVERFLRDGLITLDTPLSAAQISAGAAAIDRRLPGPPPGAPRSYGTRFGETCSFYDPELVEIIQHPYFERVAAAVLDTPSPRLFQTAITNAYPEPGVTWGYEQHVDVHYRQADWEAFPAPGDLQLLPLAVGCE